MPTVKTIREVYGILEKIESPIAWAIGAVLIAFLIWRKFNTTEYITAGKAAFDQLNTLCDQIQEENELIQRQLAECRTVVEKLKNDVDRLKSDKFDKNDN